MTDAEPSTRRSPGATPGVRVRASSRQPSGSWRTWGTSPLRAGRSWPEAGPQRRTAQAYSEPSNPDGLGYKKGFGFHPLFSFVDHGSAGTGEPLSVLLRPGNAGSNTATDHIAVIKAALAQLPSARPGKRAGRKVLIRTDSAGCTHKALTWMAGQRLSYSVGFPLPHNTTQLLELIPADVWTPAYDAHDEIRDGAWVAELTGLLDLTGWPKGMRVIVRKERPHPGAQLRITDVDGHRVTAFATNTRTGGPATQLPDLRYAPPPRPVRGPDQGLQGHRADEPAPVWVCSEPHLVRHRGPGRGDHRGCRCSP